MERYQEKRKELARNRKGKIWEERKDWRPSIH
jgi:hypothetical protein